MMFLRYYGALREFKRLLISIAIIAQKPFLSALFSLSFYCTQHVYHSMTPTSETVLFRRWTSYVHPVDSGSSKKLLDRVLERSFHYLLRSSIKKIKRCFIKKTFIILTQNFTYGSEMFQSALCYGLEKLWNIILSLKITINR